MAVRRHAQTRLQIVSGWMGAGKKRDALCFRPQFRNERFTSGRIRLLYEISNLPQVDQGLRRIEDVSHTFFFRFAILL